MVGELPDEDVVERGEASVQPPTPTEVVDEDGDQDYSVTEEVPAQAVKDAAGRKDVEEPLCICTPTLFMGEEGPHTPTCVVTPEPEEEADVVVPTPAATLKEEEPGLGEQGAGLEEDRERQVCEAVLDELEKRQAAVQLRGLLADYFSDEEAAVAA